MPPRKKQRTDSGGAPAPRRMTRAATKAISEGGNGTAPVVNAMTTEIQAASEGTITRATSETRKRVVRKGRLRTLLDMPLEIQLEVYNHLSLGDLFNLARTCKTFRTFILNPKNEIKLWVPARENTPGFPQRPPFMTEPAFVHLLCSTHCHNCGAPNIRKILYGCFTRLCSTCYQLRTVWYEEAAVDAVKMVGGWFLSKMFVQRALSVCFSVQGGSGIGKLHRDDKCDRLYRDHVEHIFELWKALPAPMTADVFEAFSAQIATDYRARAPFARAVQTWMDAQEAARQTDLANARQQRFDNILDRLRNSGWGKELDFMGKEGQDTMWNMPVIRQSSKLTEGAWKKVFAALKEYLTIMRTSRLDDELRTALDTRFDALEEAIVACYVTLPRNARMDCRPKPIDFAFTPECRAILDVPTSETVTADQFAPILPALCEKWEADCQKDLTDYLLPYLGDVAADVDPLELAIAVFKRHDPDCAYPLGLLRYPSILAHENCRNYACLRTSRSITLEKYLQGDAYTRAAQANHWMDAYHELLAGDPSRRPLLCVPFHLDNLPPYDSKISGEIERMRRVVSLFGLDPARATFDELEKCGVWLRCVTCETRQPNEEIRARSWMAVYVHEYHHVMDWHPDGRAPAEWRRADEEDMEKVRAVLKERFLRVPEYDNHRAPRWACSLCATFNAMKKAMFEHLENTHSITDFFQAKQDGVIYLHPSAEGCGDVREHAVRIRERVNPSAATGSSA